MRDFNFFEPFQQKEKKSQVKGLPFWAIALILLIIAASWPAYNFFRIYTLRSEAQTLEERLVNDPNYHKLAEVEQKEADLLSYQDMLASLELADETIRESELIDERLFFVISGTLPRDLALNSMSINGRNIQVQGFAGSKPAIAEMEFNLRNTGEFENIFVPSISENNGLFNFGMTFQIRGVSNGASD